MHVGGGGEVLETPTIEGERIARVTYLGSLPDANGDHSSAVHANAQGAKQQIIRIRPLLKVPRFASDEKPHAPKQLSSSSYYMGLL